MMILLPSMRICQSFSRILALFVLRDIYTQYTEETFGDLTDAEKAAVVTEFQCSLFDDLNIRLKDVFAHLIDK